MGSSSSAGSSAVPAWLLQPSLSFLLFLLFFLFPLFSSLPSHSSPLLSPGASCPSRVPQQADIDGFVQSCTLHFYIWRAEMIHYQIQRGKSIRQCASCTLKNTKLTLLSPQVLKMHQGVLHGLLIPDKGALD